MVLRDRQRLRRRGRLCRRPRFDRNVPELGIASWAWTETREQSGGGIGKTNPREAWVTASKESALGEPPPSMTRTQRRPEGAQAGKPDDCGVAAYRKTGNGPRIPKELCASAESPRGRAGWVLPARAATGVHLKERGELARVAGEDGVAGPARDRVANGRLRRGHAGTATAATTVAMASTTSRFIGHSFRPSPVPYYCVAYTRRWVESTRRPATRTALRLRGRRPSRGSYECG